MKDKAKFSRDNQIAILHKAMKGVGTREKSILDVLGGHSSDQRLQIKNGYKTRYRKVRQNGKFTPISQFFAEIKHLLRNWAFSGPRGSV